MTRRALILSVAALAFAAAAFWDVMLTSGTVSQAGVATPTSAHSAASLTPCEVSFHCP
jgi:hypothetical protein